MRPRAITRAQARELCEHWSRPLAKNVGENPFVLRKELEDVMWEKVGIVRHGKDLEKAIGLIQSLAGRATAACAPGEKIFNAKWNEAINVANLSLVAEAITRSALLREESRGAHYRMDFPGTNASWLQNIHLAPENGSMKLYPRRVEFSRLKPPEFPGVHPVPVTDGRE